jgi:hypothetical protein
LLPDAELPEERWPQMEGLSDEPPIMSFGASILLVCRSSFPTVTRIGDRLAIYSRPLYLQL